jgi:hypothetical protein
VTACAHCGRGNGPKAKYAGVILCYPDSPAATACLRRVRGGEQLGALKGVRPLPQGMDAIRAMSDAPA